MADKLVQEEGVAAATAVRHGVSCRQVNTTAVQKALEDQGVRIK